MNKNIFLSIYIITLVLSLVPSTVGAQEKQAMVHALKGDGALKLLRRHKIPLEQLDAFYDLNKDNLGENNTLFEGSLYKLPEIPKKEEAVNPIPTSLYPIFGKEYQEVPIENEQLKGAVFFLVAGHGGPDPGAIGKYGKKTVSEDEYAYDVTLRLARNLIMHEALVYMIIRDPKDGIREDKILPLDKDEVCYPNKTIPLGQVARLKQRAEAVNTLSRKHKTSYQRLITLHVDSRSKGKRIDVFFYHYKKSKKGKKLAQNLHQTFDEKYQKHQPYRGYHGTISSRDLYMVEKTRPISVFIELGNIQNPRDQKRFVLEDNRQALANWITQGLIKDYKESKKKKS